MIRFIFYKLYFFNSLERGRNFVNSGGNLCQYQEIRRAGNSSLKVRVEARDDVSLTSCVCVCVCVSPSVMSNSLWPHGLYPARLLCPRNFPGKNTGVDCHLLLQRIFPTQGLNLGLLHCRWCPYHLSHTIWLEWSQWKKWEMAVVRIYLKEDPTIFSDERGGERTIGMTLKNLG